LPTAAVGAFFALVAAAGFAIGLAAVFILPVFVAPAKPQVSVVVFPEGSSLASGSGIVPKVIRVTMGVNNTVLWTNQDETSHSVVSDTYVDPVSGAFDSYAKGEGPIAPGETFEFTFTQPGTYDYYMVPHPHMQGTVIVDPPTL
jgi:plastocyanin